jgi:hypothetical protein
LNESLLLIADLRNDVKKGTLTILAAGHPDQLVGALKENLGGQGELVPARATTLIRMV